MLKQEEEKSPDAFGNDDERDMFIQKMKTLGTAEKKQKQEMPQNEKKNLISEEVAAQFGGKLAVTPLMVQDPSIFFGQFEAARMAIIEKFGNKSGYDVK